MGQVKFTPTQKLVFEAFSKFTPLRRKFYLTGGTALSAFYLHHRWSEDLDFFSENELEDKLINRFMAKISLLTNLKHRFTKVEETRIFEFEKSGKLLIKIDFAQFPYKRLKPGKVYKRVSIDSLLDIATNKLLILNQRTEIKDFVDLFFLLKKFTLWDLIYAVEKKFNRETDVLLLGAEFLKVREFDYLPKMITPLNLAELQKFFVKKAKEVASQAVK